MMNKYYIYNILLQLHLISIKKSNSEKSKYIYNYILLSKSKLFNKTWYLTTYQDVKDANCDPIKHYLQYGWKEGRNPSIYFNTNDYLNKYQDVKNANICPLVHYIDFGKNEGREPQSDFRYNRETIITKILQGIKRLFILRKIKKNKNARILVILHLFYMDSWSDIKEYLKNLNSYNYKLIVTIVNGYYSDSILDEIRNFKSNAEFIRYNNQGYDVGSFVDVITKVELNDYDIIYKLQSKGTKRPRIYIYNQIFKNKDWFQNLYNGILGTISTHQCIDTLLNNNKIGIVAAKNLIIHDPKHKQCFTNKKAEELGIIIKKDYQYVAGTCFAIKSKLLQPIKDLNLSINNFENTIRGNFSLAHTMERLICAIIEPQGYDFYGIHVKHNIYKNELKKENKYSAINLLNDKNFILDYDFFYKVLELRKIKHYEVRKIKLKDIKRYNHGKYYSLNDVAPMAYLKGNKEAYKLYCIENEKDYGFQMSSSKYQNLIESINSGFNFKSMPVLNALDLSIMDGQHRCCYMMHKYGENYEIPCLLITFLE